MLTTSSSRKRRRTTGSTEQPLGRPSLADPRLEIMGAGRPGDTIAPDPGTRSEHARGAHSARGGSVARAPGAPAAMAPSDGSQDGKTEVRVTDRRRFTETGDARGDEGASEEAPPPRIVASAPNASDRAHAEGAHAGADGSSMTAADLGV